MRDTENEAAENEAAQDKKPEKHEISHAVAARRADGTFDLPHMKENVSKAIENIEAEYTSIVAFTERSDITPGHAVFFHDVIAGEGVKYYLLGVKDA